VGSGVARQRSFGHAPVKKGDWKPPVKGHSANEEGRNDQGDEDLRQNRKIDSLFFVEWCSEYELLQKNLRAQTAPPASHDHELVGGVQTSDPLKFGDNNIAFEATGLMLEDQDKLHSEPCACSDPSGLCDIADPMEQQVHTGIDSALAVSLSPGSGTARCCGHSTSDPCPPDNCIKISDNSNTESAKLVTSIKGAVPKDGVGVIAKNIFSKLQNLCVSLPLALDNSFLQMSPTAVQRGWKESTPGGAGQSTLEKKSSSTEHSTEMTMGTLEDEKSVFISSDMQALPCSGEDSIEPGQVGDVQFTEKLNSPATGETSAFKQTEYFDRRGGNSGVFGGLRNGGDESHGAIELLLASPDLLREGGESDSTDFREILTANKSKSDYIPSDDIIKIDSYEASVTSSVLSASTVSSAADSIAADMFSYESSEDNNSHMNMNTIYARPESEQVLSSNRDGLHRGHERLSKLELDSLIQRHISADIDGDDEDQIGTTLNPTDPERRQLGASDDGLLNPVESTVGNYHEEITGELDHSDVSSNNLTFGNLMKRRPMSFGSEKAMRQNVTFANDERNALRTSSVPNMVEKFSSSRISPRNPSSGPCVPSPLTLSMTKAGGLQEVNTLPSIEATEDVSLHNETPSISYSYSLDQSVGKAEERTESSGLFSNQIWRTRSEPSIVKSVRGRVITLTDLHPMHTTRTNKFEKDEIFGDIFDTVPEDNFSQLAGYPSDGSGLSVNSGSPSPQHRKRKDDVLRRRRVHSLGEASIVDAEISPMISRDETVEVLERMEVIGSEHQFHSSPSQTKDISDDSHAPLSVTSSFSSISTTATPILKSENFANSSIRNIVRLLKDRVEYRLKGTIQLP